MGSVLLILLVFCVVISCFVCLRRVYCVPNITCVSVLSFLTAPSVFTNVYSQITKYLSFPLLLLERSTIFDRRKGNNSVQSTLIKAYNFRIKAKMCKCGLWLFYEFTNIIVNIT